MIMLSGVRNKVLHTSGRDKLFGRLLATSVRLGKAI